MNEGTLNILNTIKGRCESSQSIHDLYILIDSIKSVLIHCLHTIDHPFYIMKVKLLELEYLLQKKMINDIIDSISTELKYI